MEQTVNKIQILRSFIGTVMAASVKKTIVVKVDTMKMHSKYHKQFRVSRKYHVHDEDNTAKVGDTVKIVACRPLSATKRWRLEEIVKTSQ